MQSKHRILAFVAMATVACLGVSARAQNENTPEAKARKAMIGKAAPELSVDQWIHTDGKNLSLKSLRGKVVVLDFFTYW